MPHFPEDEIDATDVPLLLEEVDEVELAAPVAAGTKRSFIEEYVTSKMQPGSVKGSMFTMTVATVGAGVLALPYALEQAGLVMGIGLLILGGLLAYFSLYLLVVCSDLSKSVSYMHLATITSGTTLAGFVQLVISLNLFGTSVGYLVASSELILLIVKPNGDHPSPDAATQSRNALIGTLCICFVLPLSLFRSLSSLRFSSLFSLLCIFFLTSTVVVKYFQFVHLGYAPSFAYQWAHLPLFTLDMRRILKALPLVIFAFTCHPNVLPIYLQLQRRSSVRMYKVARRSLGLATTLYVVLGTSVFLTFGMDTRSNFLQNNYHQDAAIVAGAIFFAVALVLTTPLYIHTLRNGLNETLWNGDQGTWCRHVIVTLVLVGAACGVAIAAGDIASVLGILGSTTNPIICFVLPAFYMCKIAPDAYWLEKGTSVVVCVVVGGLCIASLVEQVRSGGEAATSFWMNG
ncbi:Aste57867_24513 [Aphanomyces stellatus]|uniref:Aste57867_24513 protein n=1 Tax=Aphanomyces stellatus TaxID=120398 RepID=A0A485LQJ8_9STRA|nr:hypothetical protein As57867_024436 [Aphanomyces stellatus]VFU01152.1 Aste57867_24513 [Aphanomyces stellatus]